MRIKKHNHNYRTKWEGGRVERMISERIHKALNNQQKFKINPESHDN